MPILKWDLTDFIDCLEVLPEVEDGLEYVFRVEKIRLTLVLVVRPYESVVDLALFQEGEETPITEFSLLVRGSVRLVKGKHPEYLEFQGCVPSPNGYYHSHFNFDPFAESFKYSVTMQIAVKPSIQIRYLGSRN